MKYRYRIPEMTISGFADSLYKKKKKKKKNIYADRPTDPRFV